MLGNMIRPLITRPQSKSSEVSPEELSEYARACAEASQAAQEHGFGAVQKDDGHWVALTYTDFYSKAKQNSVRGMMDALSGGGEE